MAASQPLFPAVFLRETFESLRPLPVFVASGPEDAAGPLSPYLNEAWPANVHFFLEPQWQARDLKNLPLTIVGRGYAADGAYSDQAPTIGSDRAVVALAWGDDGAGTPFGCLDNLPFSAHFAALGLARKPLLEERGTCLAAFSGSPECTGFDDEGAGHYLEIELASKDDGTYRATAQQVPVAGTAWLSVSLEAGPGDTADALAARIRDEAPRRSGLDTVVRVRLKGALRPEVQAALPDVQQRLLSEYAWISIEDGTVYPEDYAALSAESTTLGAFAARIAAAMADAPDENERRLLARVRDVGVAAYRGIELPLRGAETSSR